jgi:predicted deacylase
LISERRSLDSEFKIAGTTVKPGSKVRNYLRVGPYFYQKMHIRNYVLIPFTVVRGVNEGPTLVQTAGCHPTEYSGIDATIRLSNTVRPEELKGTYIAVPCVNIPGFYERTYINPIDEKNIQGLYPGKADGTISDLMAYTLFNEIVLKSNYFLDCHGGDIHESEIWSFIYYKTKDETEKRSETIAKATALTYLRTSDSPGSMGMEAARRKISGGLFELCSGDRLLPEESAAIYDGSVNVMRHLGMLDGKPKSIQRQPCTTEGQKQEILTSRASAYFTKSGLYHTNVKPGDLLKEGQVVGTVTDFWGEEIETIRAPATGRVFLHLHNPAVKVGDEAISIVF